MLQNQINPSCSYSVTAISITLRLSFGHIAAKENPSKEEQNHNEKYSSIIGDYGGLVFFVGNKEWVLFEDFCFFSEANFAVLTIFSICWFQKEVRVLTVLNSQ